MQFRRFFARFARKPTSTSALTIDESREAIARSYPAYSDAFVTVCVCMGSGSAGLSLASISAPLFTYAVFKTFKTMRAIGLMSGTSVDGIDVALVDLQGRDRDLKVKPIEARTVPYAPALRQRILDLASGAAISLPELADLDDAIAIAFADAANVIQEECGDVELIGSHGQTVYHQPPQYRESEALSTSADNAANPINPANSIARLGYSLQLGRGTTIAQLTGVPTISNFRAADLAAGGQGAPLVPRIDACLLGHATQTTCIQNIGGIGNVAYIPRRILPQAAAFAGWEFGDDVLGWDTGPGNLPIDLAVHHFSDGEKTYDRGGAWAATGQICQPLLDRWLSDPFFGKAPPKSTGREYFGKAFAEGCIADAQSFDLDAASTLATLSELTAASVVESYRSFLPALPDRVLLCGGGSRNTYLKERIQSRLGTTCCVQTTDEVGIDADSKEAIAFAILAYWRWYDIPGNLPNVTGAARSVVLGELHFPAFDPVSV